MDHQPTRTVFSLLLHLPEPVPGTPVVTPHPSETSVTNSPVRPRARKRHRQNTTSDPPSSRLYRPADRVEVGGRKKGRQTSPLHWSGLKMHRVGENVGPFRTQSQDRLPHLCLQESNRKVFSKRKFNQTQNKHPYESTVYGKREMGRKGKGRTLRLRHDLHFVGVPLVLRCSYFCFRCTIVSDLLLFLGQPS